MMPEKQLIRYLHRQFIPDTIQTLITKSVSSQQGVFDAYGNPTGKKAVFLGDYLVKAPNQLTGKSKQYARIDVLNFVTDLQKQISK